MSFKANINITLQQFWRLTTLVPKGIISQPPAPATSEKYIWWNYNISEVVILIWEFEIAPREN